MKEGDVTEEDEEDEDGIRFATLESRFENKKTGLNWYTVETVNLSCHQCKKMVKASFALAKYLT